MAPPNPRPVRAPTGTGGLPVAAPLLLAFWLGATATPPAAGASGPGRSAQVAGPERRSTEPGEQQTSPARNRSVQSVRARERAARLLVRPPARRGALLDPGEHVTLQTRNADLVEVLRSFATLGGFHLIVEPGIRGEVTVELVDVPWERALGAILRMHGLAAEIDGSVVAVGERGRPR